MRHVPARCAVVLLLLFVTPLLAQVGRDIRFITAEEAEVRCGASDKPELYVTNRLRRGQPVEVMEETPGGWLAIRPPEGSFSYINTRFLRHLYPDMPNYVVTLDGVEVDVFTGSDVVNKRPTIVGSKLVKGTQVTSRGKPLADEDGTWMPIEPPERERRYVRASQVAKKMPEPGGAAVAAAGGAPAHSAFTPASSPVAASPLPSANPPATPERLYQQAQQAERMGQLAEAIRLYALTGAEAARSQPGLSAMALQRAQYLQGGHQNYGGVPPPPPMYGENRAGVATSTVQVPAASRAVALQPASSRGGTPSTWMRYRGVLRKAGRAVEGHQAYALDDPETLRPVLYAVAPANLRLEEHLNHVVELYGYTVYRGDLKNNLMTVGRVVRSP